MNDQPWCDDGCYNNRKRWKESVSQEYSDRTRLECKKCGKFIGYRMKERPKHETEKRNRVASPATH